MTLAPDVKAALDGLNARRAAYASYQAWYDGAYDLRRLLDRLPIRNAYFKDALCSLSENLCPLVVDTLADRLQLQGVESEAYSDRCAQILDRWRIDAFQGEVHRQTSTQGDGYVLVWGDPGQVPNAWFHSGQEMTVVRSASDPSLLDMAIKHWDDPLAGMTRMTIYYPDRVERYGKPLSRTGSGIVSGVVGTVATLFNPNHGDNWDPFDLDGPAVVRNPIGVVPVAVYNNGRYRAFGRSELHDVIGPQRMLNKSLVDLALASEGNGVSNRWILGLDFSIDPETGKPAHGFDPKDPIWAFGGKKDEMAFGQFAATDLEKLASGSVDTYRKIIARVSRTPNHYLGEEKGTWPSGEALKTAEAPFSAKVKRRQSEWGEPWEDAVRFALMFGGAKLDTPLEAKWKDTSPRHELEYWQGQEIQAALGKSEREIWREEGYSDSEWDKMVAERKAESESFAADVRPKLSTGTVIATGTQADAAPRKGTFPRTVQTPAAA